MDREFPRGDLRVSDADRDQAVSALSRAFQVGRITADEFDERSGQALRARTWRELAALLADLPADEPATRQPEVPVRARRSAHVSGVMVVSAAAAALLSVIAMLNAVNPGPTAQQRALAEAIAARTAQTGRSVTFHVPGFNWAGTLVPAGLALLLVMLIILLRGRHGRPGGEQPGG